jgi:hypothetical protein
VKGIQVCSKEGDSPSPRGDNSERVKMHWYFLKIFFRTSRPKSIKLGTNNPLVERIQIKGQALFKGDNHKNVRKGWSHLKVLFWRTMKPENLNSHETFWHRTKASWLKKLKIIAPYGLMGQMEMRCIFNIGKKISILAKATQVSDLGHGPLV